MDIEHAVPGDLVYGLLPHPDGWNIHYGIVAVVVPAKGFALVVSGTSQSVPRTDADLRVGEVVLRTAMEVRLAGLKKPTLFKFASHLRPISALAVGRLERTGTLADDDALMQKIRRATRAALDGWTKDGPPRHIPAPRD